MFSLNSLASIEVLSDIRAVDSELLKAYVSDILEVSKSISFHDNGKHRKFSKDAAGIIQVNITREVI